MIIVREVFTAKPGMASKLARLFKSALASQPGRAMVMTDLVGKFNTVVLETEYASLTEFEARMKDYMENEEWRSRMVGYTEMYQTGKREIYQIV